MGQQKWEVKRLQDGNTEMCIPALVVGVIAEWGRSENWHVQAAMTSVRPCCSWGKDTAVSALQHQSLALRVSMTIPTCWMSTENEVACVKEDMIDMAFKKKLPHDIEWNICCSVFPSSENLLVQE